MENKKAEYLTVEQYIAQCEPDKQAQLREMREVIRKAAPEAAEKISWGMPTYSQHGNVVHFAAGKNHIGLYPGASGVKNFAAKLLAYKTSKGAIQFPVCEPMPWELVDEIVRFRVAENKQEKQDKDEAEKKNK